MALGAIPMAVEAQAGVSVEVRIEPERPALGEVFSVEIQLSEGEEGSLRGPAELTGLQGLHLMAGPNDDGVAQGPGPRSLHYLLLPMRPGYRPLPSVLIRHALPGDSMVRAQPVPLGGVMVESVLPPPSEPVELAPLLGSDRGEGRSGPLLPLSLAGSLLFGISWLWSRRIPGRSTQERAEVHHSGEPDPWSRLRELARSKGTDRSDSEPDVDEASCLLRDWVRRQNPAVSSSHTVPEIGALLRENGNDGPVRLLRTADRIRFGVKPTPEEEVAEFWARLDTWVATRGGADV
jgi:hypothetical protein